MCVAPGSQFFWIGLALFAVIGLVFARTLLSFLQEFARASTAETRAQAAQDHANSLITHGLWFTIMVFAGGACGVSLF